VAAPRKELTSYRGHPVTGSTVAIRNTGDGLSAALAVEPVELPLQGTVHVVLECEVEKHRYDPVKDTSDYILVNMLKAGRATLVDRDLVEKYLDDQQRRIDEAKGEPQLDLDSETDDE
jgi:hypothetical protein